MVVCIHDVGCCGTVGVDKITACVFRGIGAFRIFVTERGLQCAEKRRGLAVALEFALCNFIYRVAGNKNCDFLFWTKEETQKSLPYTAGTAGYNVVCLFFETLIFKLCFICHRSFSRVLCTTFYCATLQDLCGRSRWSGMCIPCLIEHSDNRYVFFTAVEVGDYL